MTMNPSIYDSAETFEDLRTVDGREVLVTLRCKVIGRYLPATLIDPAAYPEYEPAELFLDGHPVSLLAYGDVVESMLPEAR